jgi:hypothetical protein
VDAGGDNEPYIEVPTATVSLPSDREILITPSTPSSAGIGRSCDQHGLSS